jgi:hypothetical protein
MSTNTKGESGFVLYKTSMISGKVHSMELPGVTEEAYRRWLCSPTLIQDAFPHLSADQREFMMTGITPEEWNEAFGDDDSVEQGRPK